VPRQTPTPLTTHVGAALRAARKQRGLKLADIAEATGWSMGHCCAIETGGLVRLEHAAMAAAVIGVSLRSLLPPD
jgi:transcriptional regulator with XRE-family HTH domain